MDIPSVYRLAAEALKIMRAHAPFDTGNLRDNGMFLHRTADYKTKYATQYTIAIGGDLAPYAVYTNEAWVAPYWKGRRNPNQHWIDVGVQNVVNYICAATGGTLVSSEGEADRWINKSYWESDEGKERLVRYGISDYKSAVS